MYLHVSSPDYVTLDTYIINLAHDFFFLACFDEGDPIFFLGCWINKNSAIADKTEMLYLMEKAIFPIPNPEACFKKFGPTVRFMNIN